jgi:hypothetical protein
MHRSFVTVSQCAGLVDLMMSLSSHEVVALKPTPPHDVIAAKAGIHLEMTGLAVEAETPQDGSRLSPG